MIAGIVIAVAAHLWREIRLNVHTRVEDATLRPPAGCPLLRRRRAWRTAWGGLPEHQAATRLVVHLDGLGRIDLTGALALRNLLIDAREAGLDVRVVDVPLQAAKTVERTLVEVVPVTMLDEREV